MCVYVAICMYMYISFFFFDPLSFKKLFLKKDFLLLLHFFSPFLALQILFDLLLSYLLIWKVASYN